MQIANLTDIRSVKTLIISADDNLTRLLVSYTRTAKELYNSLLMYILSSYVEPEQSLDLTKLADYAVKLRSYKTFDPDIAKYTLAYMLYQIEHLNDIAVHFKQMMSIKYFPIVVPSDKLEYDTSSSCYVINFGSGLNIYINHKQYRSKCFAYIIPFMTNSSNVAFGIELTRHYAYLEKYVKIIEKVLTTSVANTSVVLTSDEKPFNEFNILSIDIGSRNFASCISTATFEPFVINADYIFNLHQVYLNKLNKLNTNVDVSKVSDLNKKIQKVMRRFISRCTQYLVKYCINNDICDVVVGITGNRCLDLKQFKGMFISEFNFAPILQGLFRTELQTKCTKNGIKFYEIDEHRTSSVCCRCGYYSKKGRNRSTNIFTCKRCNLIIHGDINAAINILKRYCKNYFEPETFRENLFMYIDKTIDYETMSNVKNIIVMEPSVPVNSYFD